MEIRTYKDLEKALKQVAKEALEESKEEMKDIVKDKVDELVYDQYAPTIYDKTYELRDSIVADDVKEKGDTFEAEIHHDTNLIHPNADLGQHASLIDRKSSVNNIAEIVHEGLAPNIFNDRVDYIWMYPRPYMDVAWRDIKDNNKYKDAIKRSLAKKGIKTE